MKNVGNIEILWNNKKKGREKRKKEGEKGRASDKKRRKREGRATEEENREKKGRKMGKE